MIVFCFFSLLESSALSHIRFYDQKSWEESTQDSISMARKKIKFVGEGPISPKIVKILLNAKYRKLEVEVSLGLLDSPLKNLLKTEGLWKESKEKFPAGHWYLEIDDVAYWGKGSFQFTDQPCLWRDSIFSHDSQ